MPLSRLILLCLVTSTAFGASAWKVERIQTEANNIHRRDCGYMLLDMSGYPMMIGGLEGPHAGSPMQERLVDWEWKDAGSFKGIPSGTTRGGVLLEDGRIFSLMDKGMGREMRGIIWEEAGSEGEAANEEEARDNVQKGTWKQTASPRLVRDEFTQTLLPDGRVLIVGGRNGKRVDRYEANNRFPQEVERYHPDDDAWNFAAPLAHGRADHSATLTHVADVPVVVVAGGINFEPRVVHEIEVYLIKENKWIDGGALQFPRQAHSAVALPNGQVAFIGGYGTDGKPVKEIEIWDPVTRQTRVAGQLAVPRGNATATYVRIGTRVAILVAGGMARVSAEDSRIMPTASLELYDPYVQRSQEVANLKVARHRHSAVMMGDVLVIAGGRNAQPLGYSPLGHTEFFRVSIDSPESVWRMRRSEGGYEPVNRIGRILDEMEGNGDE